MSIEELMPGLMTQVSPDSCDVWTDLLVAG
jgi:hypothetical protein